jgi:hypothetical protein
MEEVPMHVRRRFPSCLAGAALALLPSLSWAQVQLPAESSPLNVIKRLFCANFDGSSVFSQTVGGGAVITPVSTNLVNGFLFQSQTFPNASSTAGFTFTWAQGAPVASELYGPLFGERGLTNGKNKLSATLSFQELSWETFDDQEIRAEAAGLAWGDLDPVGLLPSDAYRGICHINLKSKVVLLALNYGLLRRLDVSVTVPFVSTTVNGTSEFTPAAGTSVGNLPPQSYSATGEASGIGDVGVGVKLGLVDSGSFSLAVSGGAGFGTGSADKMTGTGQTSFSGLLVTSWEKARVSIHGQAGYIGATGEADEASPLGVGRFDEFDYVVGVDYAAVPERLTLGAELVARRLLDAPTFDEQSLTAQTRNVDVYFISVGGKVRVVQRLLATAYVLIPAGSSGMLPNRPSFNAGLNYVF